MSITEFQRHQIFQWFESQMGPERAAIMMDLLPPVGWGDMVTGSELRAELALLRAETASEFAVVRGEFADLRGEFSGLRGEFAELRGEFAGLRGEFAEAKGEMHLSMANQTRSLMVGMVASNATLVGLVLAAIRLA